MRPIRALTLTTAGAVGGLAAAAALVRRAFPSRGGEDSDELALVAIFDSIDLKSRASAFAGGSVLAWFGGVALDLREAVPEPDARLTVHALFGGVTIHIPPGWRLVSNLSTFAGGTDVREGKVESPDAPTLTLDGRAIFGGIAVGARTPVEVHEETAAA